MLKLEGMVYAWFSTRKQFYIGQIIVYTIMLIIIAPIFIFIAAKNPGILDMSDSSQTKLVLAIAYFTITPVQLSAFVRRMNDAAMSRWFALILLFPIVGNVLATVLGIIFPTNYGVERYY